MKSNRELLEESLDEVQRVGGYDNLPASTKQLIQDIQGEVDEQNQMNDLSAMDFALGEGVSIINDHEPTPTPEGEGVFIAGGYRVHRNGVLTKDGNVLPTTQHHKSKMKLVRLTQDGVRRRLSVAGLVLTAFTKEEAPTPFRVLFRDSDTMNCHIDNLRYLRGNNEEDSI